MIGNEIAISNQDRRARFSYGELVNGFSAIEAVVKACNELADEVVIETQLDSVASSLIRVVCEENPSMRYGFPGYLSGDQSLELGRFSQKIGETLPGLSEALSQACPFYDGELLSTRVAINSNDPAFVIVSQAVPDEMTKTLIKRAFYSTLRTSAGANFLFVDLVGGGDSFPFAQELISTFPTRSSGRVFTSDRDLQRLLDKLSAESSKAISLLGDSYTTAAEYNSAQTKAIPRWFVAIAVGEANHLTEDALKELNTLVANRAKSNMDFFLIGRSDALQELSALSDVCITASGTCYYAGLSGGVEFGLQLHNPIDELNVAELIESMKSHGRVNTGFGANAGLFPDYLTMESSEALRIPFALGEDGVLQYFEIGGAASAHALLSGKTGSGKSVALHTLITQIICNYHPDDVEIWAIDYKAVEFDWYIRHRAPHFRVIARDSSDEFSYSLLDLLNNEYERRKQAFLDEGVSDINAYRRKMGERSMPRIIVFVDEFQLMTQAVQSYTGGIDYRKVLENLLRLTRAMGISFVFCSQTVASGLGGLTDAARDQIGCRLCLQQQSVEEIRETLGISGADETGIIQEVENLRKGQAVYKRARWQNEHSPDGKAYEEKLVNIIYISEEQRADAIDSVCQKVGDDYAPKDIIIVRGEARVPLTSKLRHPVLSYLSGQSQANDDYIEWYPAAPASLNDYYCVKLEDAAGSNVLIVGENDPLRDSLATHSVIGFLSDPRNRVVASFVNESYPDRKRMIEQFQRINSKRLSLNLGVDATLELLSKLKRIRPDYSSRTIYIWYGLDRLENELYLASQDEGYEADTVDFADEAVDTPQSALDDLNSFLDGLTGRVQRLDADDAAFDSKRLDYGECQRILRRAFERGPENNQYHFVFFNNRKSMKRSKLVDLSDFDNRVGTKMSSEDAFDLFGSSQAMSKANDSTAVYSSGGGRVIPLRPYLMPSDEDYLFYNESFAEIDKQAGTEQRG